MQVISFRQLSIFGGKANRSVILPYVLVVFQDFCLYLSYNNVSGVTTDSHNGHITARLPDRVYLDRTASFSFSLFIRAHQLTLESIG